MRRDQINKRKEENHAMYALEWNFKQININIYVYNLWLKTVTYLKHFFAVLDCMHIYINSPQNKKIHLKNT